MSLASNMVGTQEKKCHLFGDTDLRARRTLSILGSPAGWPRGRRAGRVDADTAGSTGGWPTGLQDPEGARGSVKSRGTERLERPGHACKFGEAEGDSSVCGSLEIHVSENS